MKKPVMLSPLALEHLAAWKKADPKIVQKIISLLVEIADTPFEGTGKPEPLKHELKGKWSRRITQEHRLVYEIKNEQINVLSCMFHYE